MFLFSVTQTLILHHYYHLVVVIGLKLRTAVLGVIYRKVSCQQGCSREGAYSPKKSLTLPQPPAGPCHHQLSQTRVHRGGDGQPHVGGCAAPHGPCPLPQHGVVCTPADFSGNLLPLAGRLPPCPVPLPLTLAHRRDKREFYSAEGPRSDKNRTDLGNRILAALLPGVGTWGPEGGAQLSFFITDALEFCPSGRIWSTAASHMFCLLFCICFLLTV